MILFLLSKPSKHICLFEVAPEEREEEVLIVEEEKVLPQIEAMVDDIKQVMKPMHLLFLIEEEEEDLLLVISNIFIVKIMTTIKFCRKKIEDDKKK